MNAVAAVFDEKLCPPLQRFRPTSHNFKSTPSSTPPTHLFSAVAASMVRSIAPQARNYLRPAKNYTAAQRATPKPLRDSVFLPNGYFTLWVPCGTADPRMKMRFSPVATADVSSLRANILPAPLPFPPSAPAFIAFRPTAPHASQLKQRVLMWPPAESSQSFLRASIRRHSASTITFWPNQTHNAIELEP